MEQFAMQVKGLPFSLYRMHRSLSMRASYAAASDIGAHHAAAWLVKVDLPGAFLTFEEKEKALITYPLRKQQANMIGFRTGRLAPRKMYFMKKKKIITMGN
jgi:hypothetical protein